MTVYVDPLIAWGQSKTWRYSENCHMTADTLEELNAMADRIGLKRSWLQVGHGQPHYDLTRSKRALAVKNGAVEITREESGEREMAYRRAHATETA
jgi:hypothetical protein